MIANPIPWPDGARCAVAMTWDMDADSAFNWYNQETVEPGLAHLRAGAPPAVGKFLAGEMKRHRPPYQSFENSGSGLS